MRRKIWTSLRIDLDDFSNLNDLAGRLRLTRSEVVRQALNVGLHAMRRRRGRPLTTKREATPIRNPS